MIREAEILIGISQGINQGIISKQKRPKVDGELVLFQSLSQVEDKVKQNERDSAEISEIWHFMLGLRSP